MVSEETSLTYFSYKNGFTENPKLDKLGRLKALTKGEKLLSKRFSYLQKGERTTNLIASETFGLKGNTNGKLSYTYNKNGNITEIREDNILIVRYRYDELNRLVREDNKPLNKTITIAYDQGGNITFKREYAFSLDNENYLELISVTPYIYADNSVMDQLLSFNGEAIEYNELGNPTKYRDKTLTWSHVNRLASIGDNISYKYNYAGIRLFKTVGDKTTKFYCSGSQVLSQTDGTDTLYFYYGSDGVTAFKYNDSIYHYVKNMFGDILAITDSDGNILTKYVYDAWGNHKTFAVINGVSIDISDRISYTESDDIATKLAILNPFRYRSYYFDIETGLYYLQSRYYDPQVGRFLSPDSLEYLDPETIHGLNLFAYCTNNPVMAIDPSGNFAFTAMLITSIILGAVFGGAISGYSAYNEGQKGWGLFGSILGGAIFGGAMGAVLSIGGAAGLASIGASVAGFSMTFSSALALSAGIGASAGLSSYMIENGLRTDRTITLTGALKSTLSGGLKALSTFAIGFIGGKYGGFDNLMLKPVLKGSTISSSVTYEIAKTMLYAIKPSLGRLFFTKVGLVFGETVTKFLLVSLPSSGIRTLIDYLFGEY